MAGEKRGAGSFADALVALAKHPSVRVMAALERGPLRLSELATSTTEEAALTAALRELDAEGFVTRKVDPGPPLRVLYVLTERGADLAPALGKLAGWVRERG